MTTSRLRVPAAAAALAATLVLASCTATQLAAVPTPGAPGFLLGLWHGFIAPIAFIVSLFSETVRIYAVPNTGGWYDLGFMIGISGFSGGVFAGSRGEAKGKKPRNR